MDIVERLRAHALPDPNDEREVLHAPLLKEAADTIDHLRRTVTEMAVLAQHSDECSWITPLPTGDGYWGCDCGLSRLVLDGEPTDEALTPNAPHEGPGGSSPGPLDAVVGRQREG